jgi:hypothetical protein
VGVKLYYFDNDFFLCGGRELYYSVAGLLAAGIHMESIQKPQSAAPLRCSIARQFPGHLSPGILFLSLLGQTAIGRK